MSNPSDGGASVGAAPVGLTRFPGGARVEDLVAVEEPLELRVDDQALAVLMRTPGDDRALAAGFLLTEGVIDGPDDLRAIAPCGDPNRPNAQNVLMIRLAAGCRLDGSRLAKARRSLFATSSCGLCGKATIDNVFQMVRPHDHAWPLPHDLVASAGDRAAQRQTLFGDTGGLHGAALFAPDGAVVGSAEDVGRHNAVDKVVGARLLADQVPLVGHTLWISGRGSFEVVQKALMAGIAALICVGAPTSLAVDLARSGNLTLVGFARGGERFNVYAGTITPGR